MTGPFAVAAAAAALLRLLAGAPVPAQPGSSLTRQASAKIAVAAPARAAAVEVTVVGSGADLARMRPLVRPRPAGSAPARWRRVDAFDPFEMLREVPDADKGSLPTRCWIDLTDRRHARLYFAGRSGTRFLIRDVALSGSFDELDLTSLAEVIDASLAAVIDDDPAGVTRAEAQRLLERQRAAPPVAAAPAAPPRPMQPPAARIIRSAPEPKADLSPAPPPSGIPGRRFIVVGGIFYAAQTFARDPSSVGGPGLVIAAPLARGGAGWQAGAWLSGQYQLATEVAGDLAGVRLAAIAARAGLFSLWPLGGESGPDGERRWRWALEARAGAGADTIHLTPRPGAVDASAMLTGARWSSNLALTGAAGVAAALGDSERVRLAVRVFADLLPVAAHYDVAVAGQRMTVVAPDRLRPGLLAELSVVLGGNRR